MTPGAIFLLGVTAGLLLALLAAICILWMYAPKRKPKPKLWDERAELHQQLNSAYWRGAIDPASPTRRHHP